MLCRSHLINVKYTQWSSARLKGNLSALKL